MMMPKATWEKLFFTKEILPKKYPATVNKATQVNPPVTLYSRNVR